METKTYLFDTSNRVKKGFLTAVTNIWMWAVFVVGIYYSYEILGTIFMMAAGIGMVMFFVIGFTNGTSMSFTRTDFQVQQKNGEWISFPYSEYSIQPVEEKRTVNLFTVSLKRHIYITQRIDGQLVYTVNARNIPGQDFKQLSFFIQRVSGYAG